MFSFFIFFKCFPFSSHFTAAQAVLDVGFAFDPSMVDVVQINQALGHAGSEVASGSEQLVNAVNEAQQQSGGGGAPGSGGTSGGGDDADGRKECHKHPGCECPHKKGDCTKETCRCRCLPPDFNYEHFIL